MRAYNLSLVFGIALLVSAHNLANSYLVSDDYSINFSTKKAEGSLSGLAGQVIFNEDDIENAIMNVTVDVATIETGNKTQDKHAKNSKWFDVEKYPTIRFVSESINRISDQYQVIGTLTIKDVSQQKKIDFQVDKSGDDNYLVGSTSVNRKDFNIQGNAIGFLVGEEVLVELRVPADFKSQE